MSGRIAASEPTHLNYVALVAAELANKIDGVDEGDLMVSLRELHMLAIMGRNTGKMKWHHAGPWIRQHDPGGNIEVFNNNIPYWEVNEGNPGPQSNIISLDPSSGMYTVVFAGDWGFDFYTDIMGSKQCLGNGNLLALESKQGRIIEVDNEGNVVSEYIKPYDYEYASLIEHAVRYSGDYLEVENWNCR